MGQPFHFYADRPAGEIRTADDVDLPAEILNYAGYREYLKIHFQALLENDHIEEWISAYHDYSGQLSVSTIMGGLPDLVQ